MSDNGLTDSGYVDYFTVLGLGPDAKPGEVRRVYKRKMKDLVNEIAGTEITEDRRSRYLLQIAELNAALFLLRDTEAREVYWAERSALIALEAKWREAAETQQGDIDELRREYDRRLKAFLSRYIEELMLEAGRDKECVEASHWNPYHERHASRLLRQYRQRLYQQLLERLPYWEVTRPTVDWTERRKTAAALLAQATE